jgi:hypothetical protein
MAEPLGFIAEQVVQAFEIDARPILRLYLAFGLNLVSAKYLVHSRGVAAASGVLQEQRVVKIVASGLRQADNFGHPRAQQAAIYRVSHGLAFGEIERERKRGNDVGKADFRPRVLRRIECGGVFRAVHWDC